MATVDDRGFPFPETRLHDATPSSPLLLQIRSDRRLGHEWDDWDGERLEGSGDFTESIRTFFLLAAAWGVLGALALGSVSWLVAPRLGGWSAGPSVALALGVSLGAWLLWLGSVYSVLATRRNWLPRWLGEGGLLPWLMPRVERFGVRVGLSRDHVGNAVLQVYNRLTLARSRPGVSPERLLILLPRCLGKGAMQTALSVSSRYGVPVFVASRGRYARQMIAMRRPDAVVAVACERDLVSGVHDVGGRLTVLGTTLRLGEGPCRNTEFRTSDLEGQVRYLLGLPEESG